ncbi:MAG TPA: hypothetical protein VEV81_16580 [Pyrinomonadaceae bacterium]|nr:hypothetical protein [Pyrinomonadaceae bacterium]
MLKKKGRPILLLALLLLATTAAPLQSQTRPRRVNPTEVAPTAPIVEGAPRRRGRSWMRILAGAAVEGIRSGGDSCTPSRDRIGRRPH